VRSLTLTLLGATGVLACESTSASAPAYVYEGTVTADMVTGAALAALRPDGKLAFELPATSEGQLALQEAKSEALQFARYVTNNIFLRSGVEYGRGGYWTDPHLLSVCGDASYVHSLFGEITHDSLGEPGISYLRRYNGQWMIPFCGDKSEPQMVVQAAINGNDVRFANGELIQPAAFLSTAWNVRGVPLNWPDPLPISGERAVRFAFESFGVRVSEVPQLFMRGDVLPDGRFAFFRDGAMFLGACYRWRIVLEGDVHIRGMTSFNITTTNVLWVGTGTCNAFDVVPYVHVPSSTQPAVITMTYLDNLVNPPKTWVVALPLAAPVLFEIGTRAPQVQQHHSPQGSQRTRSPAL
jgi:hypothetical protein